MEIVTALAEDVQKAKQCKSRFALNRLQLSSVFHALPFSGALPGQQQHPKACYRVLPVVYRG